MDRMIQDIFPSCYQVAYQPRPPKPEDKCFFFRGRTVLERWDGEALVLPDYAAVAAHIGQPQFLFIIDETAYYLAEYPNALESPEGYEWHDLRHERSKKSRVLCFAEATAYHLAEWYGANRFCGQCGERTQPDLVERMLRCPKCGNLIYPKIAPAVIVAVTRGDQILMTRYQGRDYKGYALIAGFTEIGETAEDTVRREVMEEVGLPVHHLRYVGSQPWGVSGSLMCAFQGETDSSLPLKIQRSELADAKWVSRGQLSAPASTFSVAQELIERFRQGKL